MTKLLAIFVLGVAFLVLGGCADRATESRRGADMDRGSTQASPDSGAERTTELENCVTAVGADRKNCAAK